MQLILGDCLEKMKDIPDGSIDAIITDPPYGLGFMGKEWDKTGIANNVNMWKECLRVLKSGGHLLSFGGTRTYHRMAVAIEDAGFEVRDMVEWVYGSGFPKSLNIGKAVDKLQGNEREEMVNERWAERYPNGPGGNLNPEKYTQCKRIVGNPLMTSKGTSKYEGWGTALKPAHEPICMARKPLAEKTVAENCLKWGTGGINIDESRVEGNWGGSPNRTNSPETKQVYGDYGKIESEQSPLGRFPANLIHDNSEEVRECFPNESERFFKSIIYQAKASKSERNKGCEGMEEKVGGGMAGTVDQTLLTGSGNIRNNLMRNNHPTVKPIVLMEYLITMVTPKNGTVFDPFMGSGTTGVACKNLNREFIGIELDPAYYEIAVNRLSSLSTNE